jgi:hypothetical protein
VTGPVLPDERARHVRALLPPPWDALAPLIAESEAEGFRHLARLRDEYAGGRATHRRVLRERSAQPP